MGGFRFDTIEALEARLGRKVGDPDSPTAPAIPKPVAIDYGQLVQNRQECRMNGTEKDYSRHLDMLQRAGSIISWGFEQLKLRLANNTFYTPDFLVVCHNRILMDEVKGFWRDDARVKIKVAASAYPWMSFRAVTMKRPGVFEWETF